MSQSTGVWPRPGAASFFRFRWLREPLLHFGLIGLVLFGWQSWIGLPRSPQTIFVSDDVVRGLRQDFRRRTGALPRRAEERALIQRFIDDEVLYREALALGLDRSDVIVRRRLVQKMEFLIEDEEPAGEPGERELRAYWETHRERYSKPGRLSLEHVFVKSKAGEEEEREAAGVREQILAGTDPGGLGDPFPRGDRFRLRSKAELASVFGPLFAAEVADLPVGSWSMPIRSSYGLHLVRVLDRDPPRQPDLEEVRSAVVGDWREARRKEARQAALQRLREQYRIALEDGDESERGEDEQRTNRGAPLSMAQ